ncbi:Coiled-coil domain-containing protein 173 [Geodia barretti]|uniref:Coiled-coil domain-containing protein 173 n=1 Tax=Geodia barretti TaxID=519541 RepID=A0AA35QU88_GEOBA|nr:Coiled-coil domain-containing protein 173 [Geodia barretti]
MDCSGNRALASGLEKEHTRRLEFLQGLRRRYEKNRRDKVLGKLQRNRGALEAATKRETELFVPQSYDATFDRALFRRTLGLDIRLSEDRLISLVFSQIDPQQCDQQFRVVLDISETGDWEATDNDGQVAVVPVSEWQRIKDSLDRRQREKEELCKARECRENRRLQSQNIVKHWENTIEGQRLKKLQAKKLREEEEEERKKEIERQEMEFQAQCRREAIERAKTLLYHQTDRVKTFHRALLLSEVMRERDAQLEYKKKKEEVAKTVDQTYIDIQQEERERGIAADHEAAVERGRTRVETAKFNAIQIAEKKKQREKEREEALAEQKRIDKEMEQFVKADAEAVLKKKEEQAKLRSALDLVTAEQARQQAKRQQQEKAETSGIQLFLDAKKRMTRLRKEKEREIFQQFQSQQDKMADLLQSQRLEERNTEDDMIARAMQEQYAKKEKAEEEEQCLLMERTQDIQRHRVEMTAEKERKEEEEGETNIEMLQQRRDHDLQFHQAQQEMAKQAFLDARGLQVFLHGQVAQRDTKKMTEMKKEQELSNRNQQLLELEQRQFRDYADVVISEARARGGNTQVLEKSAMLGAGGGSGPAVTGLQPSYKATDSTAVELPSYQPKSSATPANTQRRIGFTW